jgi:hypothetical protein
VGRADRAPCLSLQMPSVCITSSRSQVSATELEGCHGNAFLTRDCNIPYRAVQPHQQQMFGEELPESQDGEQPGPARRKRQPSMSEAMPLYTLCKEDLESMDKEVRMGPRSSFQRLLCARTAQIPLGFHAGQAQVP